LPNLSGFLLPDILVKFRRDLHHWGWYIRYGWDMDNYLPPIFDDCISKIQDTELSGLFSFVAVNTLLSLDNRDAENTESWAASSRLLLWIHCLDSRDAENTANTLQVLFAFSCFFIMCFYGFVVFKRKHLTNEPINEQVDVRCAAEELAKQGVLPRTSSSQEDQVGEVSGRGVVRHGDWRHAAGCWDERNWSRGAVDA